MSLFRRNRDAGPGRPPKGKRPPRPRHLRVPLLRRLRNYFFAGILITAPISITIWVVWNLLGFIDNRVTPLIPPQWNPETYLPFSVPGLGLVVAILVLVMIGFLTAGLVGRGFMAYGERLLARVPVVRSVYSATKQIFETVLAQKSTALRQVAVVEYPCRGTWAIGFLTGRTLGEVQRITKETVYNVFVPATPNPTTGFLLFIPARDVHILDMTVEEGIKLVVSGGLVTPPKQRPRSEAQARRVESSAVSEPPSAKKEGRRSAPVGRLRNYFLTGILVAAPISITFWLVWKLVSFVDARVTPLVPRGWRPDLNLPFDIPGFGLVVAVIGLTLIGMLTAGLTGRMITRLGERVLNQVPFVRNLYATIKQIFEAVLRRKSSAFREVVLIQYPRPESWAIGFFTGKTEEHVQEVNEEAMVNVFLPTTPNPTSGFLLFVPETEVVKLEMTVEQGLKMVVSGGIVTPSDPEVDSPTEEPAPSPEVAQETQETKVARGRLRPTGRPATEGR